MSKIVIKFTSGENVGQELRFDLTEGRNLSVGRDPSCEIIVQDGGAIVSRRHAEFRVKPGGAVSLVDTGSKNGVLVNNKKISGESFINQDDLVRFGTDGPVALITFDPPRSKATREVSLPETDKATREHTIAPSAKEHTSTINASTYNAVSSTTSSTATKQGIGKATLEREVARAKGEVRKESTETLTKVLALGAAAVVLIGGLSYYFYEKQQAQRTSEVRTDMKNELDKLGSQIAAANQDTGVTLKNEWGSSVVQIETSWRVVDEKGNSLYYATLNSGKRLYRRNKDGDIVPLLTTAETALPVIGSSRGSGFVVTASGHIMTNQHVAAGWTAPLTGETGLLQGPDGNIENHNYQPEKDLFLDRNMLTGKGIVGGRAIGQNLAMFVVFPNSNIRVPATLNVMSPEHDVAVIKIDSINTLKPLEFGASESITAGAKVFHIGYPDLAQKNIQIQRTKDGASAQQVTTSQDVSVSEGTVSKVVPRVRSTVADAHWLSDTGDYIEVDISSGKGSSGAPLLDKNGKVVGIVTGIRVSKNQTLERITLAVPISYGIKLLNPSSPLVKQ